MSYSPQLWIDGPAGGTPIDAAHLAHIESGVEDADVRLTAHDATLALKAPLASPTFTGTVAGVSKTHVGLGNVDNTSDTAKPVSTAQAAALVLKYDVSVAVLGLSLKADLASPTFTGTVAGVTKSMVGLGSVDNTADTAKPVSTAQLTALNLKAPIASPTFTGTVTGVTASMVGLGSVDNTTDAAKPISTAVATALTSKESLSNKGVAYGYAGLDGAGKMVGSYLTLNAVGGMPTLGAGVVGANQVALNPEQIPVAQSYQLSMGSLTGAVTPNADLVIQRYRKITGTGPITINVPTFTTVTNGSLLEGYEIEFMVKMTDAAIANRVLTVATGIKADVDQRRLAAAAQNGFIYLKIKYNSWLAAWFVVDAFALDNGPAASVVARATATTTVTTGTDIAGLTMTLAPGTWRFRAWIPMVNTSVTDVSVSVSPTGGPTMTACYYEIKRSSATGFVSSQHTAFNTASSGAAVAAVMVEIEGTCLVTVAGTYSINMTKTGTTLVTQIGAYIEATRIPD